MEKLKKLVIKHQMPLGRLARHVGIGHQAIRNLAGMGSITRTPDPGDIKAKTMIRLCEQFPGELDVSDFVKTRLRLRK